MKPPVCNPHEDAGHMLVVIDHRAARIYKTDFYGTVPQRITPYDPHGVRRHLHYVQEDSNGKRKPERKCFYEAIAKTLQTATAILLFGSATGASSALAKLLDELQKNHPAVARRVMVTIALDAPLLTENQLLAMARAFYEQHTLTQNQA